MRIQYAVSRLPLTTKAPLKDYMQDRHFTSKTRCAVFFACEKGLLAQSRLSGMQPGTAAAFVTVNIFISKAFWFGR